MPTTKTTSDNQRERREDRHAARAFRNRNEDYLAYCIAYGYETPAQ